MFIEKSFSFHFALLGRGYFKQHLLTYIIQETYTGLGLEYDHYCVNCYFKELSIRCHTYFLFTVNLVAQEQQCRHHEIDRAKEELRMKNMEILQLHALLTETEQLLVSDCHALWKNFSIKIHICYKVIQ